MIIKNEIEISFLDYPDNCSHSIIVYMAGCDFRCKGCQNEEMQELDATGCTSIKLKELFDKLEETAIKNRTNKIVLEGGDPLSHFNINDTKELLNMLDKAGYKVMIYTGNDIDFVKNNKIKGFEFIKCGQYIEELKQLPEKTEEYITFGSTNQELYDRELNLLTERGKYTFGGKINE